MTKVNPDMLKDEAIVALRSIAADSAVPAAARAAAARTILETIGAIGRLQDLTKLDDRREPTEMSPEEIASEIDRLAKKLPKPKMTKMRLGRVLK